LTTNGKGEFDQNVNGLGNNFRMEYEQFFEEYNGGQSAMVLIKNVTTTSKGNRYLKAHHYTILAKVVDEAIQTCLFQFHSKLTNVQLTLKKNIYFLPFA